MSLNFTELLSCSLVTVTNLWYLVHYVTDTLSHWPYSFECAQRSNVRMIDGSYLELVLPYYPLLVLSSECPHRRWYSTMQNSHIAHLLLSSLFLKWRSEIQVTRLLSQKQGVSKDPYNEFAQWAQYCWSVYSCGFSQCCSPRSSADLPPLSCSAGVCFGFLRFPRFSTFARITLSRVSYVQLIIVA